MTNLADCFSIYFFVALFLLICWVGRTITDQHIQIERLYTAIRKHRDQRLDDRCWMDDYELYETLPEGLAGRVDARGLPQQEMLANCKQYVSCRLTELTPDEALRAYHAWKKLNNRE